MREIKFRAWDTYDNKMEYKFTIGSVTNSDDNLWTCPTLWVEDTGLVNCDTLVLMQYTGLKDKNGVEIYEGDIVRKLSGDYKLGKVVFEFGMFCFESIGCGIYAGSDAFLYIHSLHYKEYNSNNNYEVIGNIYENPELLESKC